MGDGQAGAENGRLVGVHGYTRVTYPAPTWDDLLALATDEIRMYGSDSLQVVRRLRRLFLDLAATVAPARRAAGEDPLGPLAAPVKQSIPEPRGRGLSHVA